MRIKLLVASLYLCACGTPNGQQPDGGGPVDAANDFDTGVQCVPSMCPSGVCGPDDMCAQTCTSTSGCGMGETCCNNKYCTNLAKDPMNCGACGTACSSSQFCSGASCNDALVKNVCQNASGTVVLDGIAVDQDAGTSVGAVLKADCTSMNLMSISQGQSGSIDTMSGRPELGPGNTYIAAGGGFGQKAVAYMNSARNAPVYTIDDGANVSFIRTSDNSTIIKAAISSLTAHHDYFIVYAAAEPVSGTLVFAVYGLYPAGTAAGAAWLKSQTVSSMSNHYYVLQWDDTNNNGVADAPGVDTYKQLDSK